jgi:DNA polymerase III subunit chi
VKDAGVTDAPCEVWFYHLERSTLDQVLPGLLEKTLGRGWRALVRSPDADRIEHLDDVLWSFREDSFLAHGTSEEPHAERQPVLLTQGAENPNAAQVLFLLDEAEPGGLSDFTRCILLFDGQDEAAVGAARARWKQFKAAGLPVSYWQEGAERGWEKKA